MKLWMVMWMVGEIGGVAGPLPYDKAECLARATEMNGLVAAQIATGHDKGGNPISPEARTLRAECVEAEQRPVITYTGSKR